MKRKRIVVTIALVLMLLTSIVGVAATYNYSLICFANQHVQNGYQNVAYDAFRPTYTQDVVMDFDCNSVISTGKFHVGIKICNSDGSVPDSAIAYDTVTISSTSQNLDELYYYNLSASSYLGIMAHILL